MQHRPLGEIDADIATARAALNAGVTRGTAFTLPNGVSATYSSVEDVNAHLQRLIREREAAVAAEAGSINPSVSFARWRNVSEPQ